MKEIISFANESNRIKLKQLGINSIVVPAIFDVNNIRHLYGTRLLSEYNDDKPLIIPIYTMYVNGVCLPSIVDGVSKLYESSVLFVTESFSEIFKTHSIDEVYSTLADLISEELHEHKAHTLSILEIRKDHNDTKLIEKYMSNLESSLKEISIEIQERMTALEKYNTEYCSAYAVLDKAVFYDIVSEKKKDMEMLKLKYNHNGIAQYLIKSIQNNE